MAACSSFRTQLITVRAYCEPLSVLSRRARSSSLSITPFLEFTHLLRHLSLINGAHSMGAYADDLPALHISQTSMHGEERPNAEVATHLHSQLIVQSSQRPFHGHISELMCMTTSWVELQNQQSTARSSLSGDNGISGCRPHPSISAALKRA